MKNGLRETTLVLGAILDPAICYCPLSYFTCG